MLGLSHARSPHSKHPHHSPPEQQPCLDADVQRGEESLRADSLRIARELGIEIPRDFFQFQPVQGFGRRVGAAGIAHDLGHHIAAQEPEVGHGAGHSVVEERVIAERSGGPQALVIHVPFLLYPEVVCGREVRMDEASHADLAAGMVDDAGGLPTPVGGRLVRGCREERIQIERDDPAAGGDEEGNGEGGEDDAPRDFPAAGLAGRRAVGFVHGTS